MLREQLTSEEQQVLEEQLEEEYQSEEDENLALFEEGLEQFDEERELA